MHFKEFVFAHTEMGRGERGDVSGRVMPVMGLRVVRGFLAMFRVIAMLRDFLAMLRGFLAMLRGSLAIVRGFLAMLRAFWPC